MVAPALPSLPQPEPLHKIQLVIEIVGPRSLNSALVKPLLDSPWLAAAGNPELYVMGPADTRWRELTPNDPTGSYDSLAFAWDLLSPEGPMSAESARHLLGVAEGYAEQVRRRAIPLPVPEDVDLRCELLQQIAEGLDIGVAAVVVFPGSGASDHDLAAYAAEKGLAVHLDGFAWLVPGWDEPLLTLDGGMDDPPFGATQPRSTVSVGFSLPRSPAPEAVLDAMIRLLEGLADRFGAQCVIDDAVQSPSVFREYFPQALSAFEGVGIRPGSAEARKLFPGC